MGIGGGSSRKGLYGTPDTGSMAGMPSMNGMAGMPNTNTMNGTRSSNSLYGMPDTYQMNGGKTEFEKYNERREREQKQKKQKTTQDLLEEKRKERLKDPQDARREGMIKLTQDDAYPDFISKKCKRGGSVVASPQGICLMGEDRQQSLGGEDTYVYSIKNGIREWRKANALDAKGGGGSGGEEIEVVTEIRWDTETHQLLMKKRKVKVVKADSDVEEQEEQVIFTATSHQSEHSS